MSAPAASVAAVQKALGCERGWDIARPDRECLRLGHNQNPWTDRGCPVAIAAADAAVQAATPGIAVEVLREAADLLMPFSGIGLANGASRSDVAQWLRARADRIEANR